jgi:hypothetical protein
MPSEEVDQGFEPVEWEWRNYRITKIGSQYFPLVNMSVDGDAWCDITWDAPNTLQKAADICMLHRSREEKKNAST